MFFEKLSKHIIPVDLEENSLVKKESKGIEGFRVLPLKEVLLNQYISGQYGAMDIFVRLLAIEEEFGQNNYGWALYRKMTRARIKEEPIRRVGDRVDRFKKLIKSWNTKGYDGNSYIILGKNLKLRDGAHRLALALYYGLEEIKCGILSSEFESFYGMEWFKDNGFSDEEMKLIEDKARMAFPEIRFM